MEQKFELGRLVTTRSVHDLMENDIEFKTFVKISIGKYIHNDWGDTCKNDAKMNDEAVKSGKDLILAVYKRPSPGHEDQTIWIITEWDHSVTTVLFPSEYRYLKRRFL